jgi:hypothetical protein
MNTRINLRPGSLLAVLTLALCALVLGFSPAAQAQWYPQTWTYATPASATTNTTAVAPVIDASQAHEFSLQVVGSLAGAGTTAVVYTVARSLDQTNWITAFTLSVTPAGTTPVTVATNVSAQAYPYWKVTQIANGSANIWNHNLITGVKVGVREYNR